MTKTTLNKKRPDDRQTHRISLHYARERVLDGTIRLETMATDMNDDVPAVHEVAAEVNHLNYVRVKIPRWNCSGWKLRELKITT